QLQQHGRGVRGGDVKLAFRGEMAGIAGVHLGVQQDFVIRNDTNMRRRRGGNGKRSEEHTSELQSRGHLVCRLLLEKKKKIKILLDKCLLKSLLINFHPASKNILL